jgi:transcription factor TFIIIB component B''
MQALQLFGTDFELIQNLFPGRTRRQVKAKFKNEEKLNPVRLADALGRKTQGVSSSCTSKHVASYPCK